MIKVKLQIETAFSLDQFVQFTCIDFCTLYYIPNIRWIVSNALAASKMLETFCTVTSKKLQEHDKDRSRL